MKHLRIQTPDHPDWTILWKIYEASFPSNERRTWEQHELIVENSRYHFDSWRNENDEIVGLTAWWSYDDFSFLEHFAVDPNCRGGGYGKTILTEWMNFDHPVIILEIDPVINDISQRRFNFYQRLGYVKNLFDHGHVDYLDGKGFVPLWLMSYPHEIEESLCRHFEKLQNNEMLFYFPFLRES